MVPKTAEEIERMRLAGRIVGDLLFKLGKAVRAGVTTKQLDTIAEEFIRSEKAEPAFKGYQGFPASICVSINEEVVHGIPDARTLQNGDLVSVDVGVRINGFCADAARTFTVGEMDDVSLKLIDVTKKALTRGIKKAIEGNKVSDISHAVQSFVEQSGFNVVRDFVGHGIGKEIHEEPQVPNFGKPGQGVPLVYGMALAIEPMVNAGGWEVEVLPNRWTVVTKDRKRSCHFEETVIVGKEEAEVLTA